MNGLWRERKHSRLSIKVNIRHFCHALIGWFSGIVRPALWQLNNIPNFDQSRAANPKTLSATTSTITLPNYGTQNSSSPLDAHFRLKNRPQNNKV